MNLRANESSVRVTQMGPLERRNRTAAKRNAAAIAKPIHKPGSLKNCPGPSAISELIKGLPGGAGMEGSGPAKRRSSISRKYVVLKVIFSKPQITNGGKNAHRNGARRAQAETISSQPKMGAYQRPCTVSR